MLDDETIAALVAEAGESGFEDARLRQRLARMTAKLSMQPAKAFPKVFDAAELEAAYRFFSNVVVTPEKILAGHFEHTRASCETQTNVIVVHDSSTFAFDPNGDREGLGRLRKAGQAFFGHFSLALADDGSRTPLGLAALETWVRAEFADGGERRRWRRGVEAAARQLGSTRQIVHVMDREADDYGLFADLVEHGHQFVVRLAHDRLLETSSSAEPRKISQACALVERIVQRNARLSRRAEGHRSPIQKKIHPSRSERFARLAIGALAIDLQRPRTQETTLPESLSLHLVRVWEPEPPEGEPAIEWLLLTNEPIDSADSVARIVDQYRARWTIEEYFKVLKTGCAYSTRQLGDYEALVNALAVFIPIACRALALRTCARETSEASALRVLEQDEVDVLRALGRTKLPEHPTVRDVLLAIAAIGGHIKWNGEPGWLTICRGFEELLTLTKGWRAAKLQQLRDQS